MPNMPAVLPVVPPAHAGLEQGLQVGLQVRESVSDNSLPRVVLASPDGSRDACRHCVAGSVPWVFALPAFLVLSAFCAEVLWVLAPLLANPLVVLFAVSFAKLPLTGSNCDFVSCTAPGGCAWLAVGTKAARLASGSNEKLRRGGLDLFAGGTCLFCRPRRFICIRQCAIFFAALCRSFSRLSSGLFWALHSSSPIFGGRVKA